jgi:integrase/recombinase XerC
MRLTEAIDQYLAGQPCSATEKQYRFILDRFRQLCQKRGIVDVVDVTTAEVLAFKAEQARHAPTTRTHRLAVVRSFLNTCERAGWIDRSPAAHLRLSTPRQRRSSSLSIDDQRALVAAAESMRDRVLVTLLLATGARIGELCAARVADWDGRQLRLDGKTGERFVPLGSQVAGQLSDYLSGRGLLPAEAPLLGGRKGGLTTGQAWRIFRSTCVAAGIPAQGPHQCRHAAAQRWVLAGAPIMVVSALLGHSRVSTTVDFYLHASKELMETAINEDQLLVAS